MKNKAVLKKLYTLDVLINKTESSKALLSATQLFSLHSIENQKNIMMIDEGRTTTRDIKEIMEKSNIIWTMRNKILNGEWETLQPLHELEMELKDFLRNGQKIQAIKHYRKTMKEQFQIEVTLKVAKYTMDALQDKQEVDLMNGVKD